MEMFNDQIVTILSQFDFVYMFIVNLMTYIVIKIIDELNGPKAVPVYGKRIVAVVVGIAIGITSYSISENVSAITLIYSFCLSLVSWDCIFKPILNYLGGKVNYKKSE